MQATDPELNPLFEPLQLGALTLPNRVLMAPLTRNRARPDGTPGELAETYYRQRAGAGLIVSEATQISPMGKGYKDTPGIHEDAHIEGWRKITDSVHEAGGRIAMQLWHVGRISHTSLLPDGAQPVSSTARRAKTQTFTEDGFQDVSEPRALDTDEVAGIVEDYARAAANAIRAGFDMVEVHGANGYLIDQFLQDGVNDRTDAYGGDAEGRTRFLVEVVKAVAEEVGADRTGLRLSPTGHFNDMNDSDPETTFGLAYDRLSPLGLAYLHVVERFPGLDVPAEEQAILARLRERWTGRYIANGDFSAGQAAEWIGEGRADAVAFGRAYIANPDLAERFARGASLNEPDQSTFYGGGAEGYTDYPSLED